MLLVLLLLIDCHMENPLYFTFFPFIQHYTGNVTSCLWTCEAYKRKKSKNECVVSVSLYFHLEERQADKECNARSRIKILFNRDCHSTRKAARTNPVINVVMMMIIIYIYAFRFIVFSVYYKNIKVLFSSAEDRRCYTNKCI